MLTETRGDVNLAGSPARRRAGRLRLSGGHVLMALAGVLAFVVNLVILRGADDAVMVAAASTDLQPGTILSANHLEYVEIDAASEVIGTLIPRSDADEVVGSVVTTRVGAGDLVPRGAVRAAASSQRALSIPVDRQRAVGGAIQPGDSVDLIAVDEGVARYVLVGAEVLAVPAHSTSGLAGAGPYYVVVAVDPDEALAVSQALARDAVDLVRSTGSDVPPHLVLPSNPASP